MMHRIIFTILILGGLFVESTILPFPFVFLFSVLCFFFFEDEIALVTLFVAGLFLDTLILNTIGFTPVFGFLYLLGIIVIAKLFSFQGTLFTAVVIATGVELYRYIAGYPFSIIMTTVFFLGLLLFIVIERRHKEKGVLLEKKV